MLPQPVIRIIHTCKKVFLAPERIIYTRIVTPCLVKRIRQKEKINVAFVVFELASWKTEPLYNAMKENPRFSPMILVAPSLENSSEINAVKDYLLSKGYDFNQLSNGDSIRELFRPDIIFYQKPYDWCIDKSLFFRRNLNSLFCYMSYCFRNTTKDFNQNSFFHNYAWQIYVENKSVKSEMEAIMDNKGKNLVVTGLAVMDELLRDKSCYKDPWKACGNKKRIIFAPHHTICGELVHRSTFLTFGEFMLQMAEKYKDQVQWAFKPHPQLRRKLEKVWGPEKTDAYYKRWSEMENSQFENGEYMGLFNYSDAMIHDSGSFIVEYLYTKKPVMYLVEEEAVIADANEQTRQAFGVHYHGEKPSDIEQFIKNVIQGIDSEYEKRDAFFRTHLLPPGNTSVCDNVIRSILGSA